MIAKIVLLVLACICFAFLVFGLVVVKLNLLHLGLLFFAASFLPFKD